MRLLTYLDHLEFILAWRMQDAILTTVGENVQDGIWHG